VSGAGAAAPNSPVDIRPFGDAALVMQTADTDEAIAVAAGLRAMALPGVLDVVPGLASVLVTLTPGGEAQGTVSEAMAGLGRSGASAPAGRDVELPAVFDGPDLRSVADQVGLSEAHVVELLHGATLRVAVLGFSPGFAYLHGLPAPLNEVRRRPSPRPAVPAGSIGLSAGFAAVYPQVTPGGWQLIGRTTRAMFEPHRPPHALLTPGDRVRFTPVPAGVSSPAGVDSAPRSGEGAGVGRPRRPALRATAAGAVVEAPGFLSVVQDRGRVGWSHIGVPAAGPADPVGHELANRLVGNDPGRAAIEATERGPTLRWRIGGHVALSFGFAEATLDGHQVAPGRVIPFEAGQRLVTGRVSPGLRAYVAVAGGFSVPVMLGSMSTDTLSGLGPGPLVVGDELGVAAAPGPLGGHVAGDLASSLAGEAAREPIEIRVVAGPASEAFSEGTLEELAAARFVVEGASDRVGTRLRPVAPLSIGWRGGEPVSGGMVGGAVQLPPDGTPIVLGPDHATLGGYPVVAVVIRVDIGLLGHCRPGNEVRLVPVAMTEAHDAWRELARRLSRAVVGRYPVVPG